MRALHPITPAQLPEVLLRVSLARPVHLWGAPGIGKSTMVEAFAGSLGMDCVTLMATQLAPEDIAGVPQLVTRPDGSKLITNADKSSVEILKDGIKIIANPDGPQVTEKP